MKAGPPLPYINMPTPPSPFKSKNLSTIIFETLDPAITTGAKIVPFILLIMSYAS